MYMIMLVLATLTSWMTFWKPGEAGAVHRVGFSGIDGNVLYRVVATL
jgi:hypothetical protein